MCIYMFMALLFIYDLQMHKYRHRMINRHVFKCRRFSIYVLLQLDTLHGTSYDMQYAFCSQYSIF